eukprot:2555064-Alexandrium_andersonii.AAC.1
MLIAALGFSPGRARPSARRRWSSEPPSLRNPTMLITALGFSPGTVLGTPLIPWATLPCSSCRCT